MEIFLSIMILVLLAIVMVLLFRTRKVDMPDINELENKLRFALASAASVKEIQETLEDLPHDVLESITRSLGQRTGKLNELLATFELTQYDRLFYLGEPVDFIGVKYGEGIDFIEVKTGRASLSKAERELKDLIECKLVNYVPLSVSKIGFPEEIDTRESVEE
ncbi:MAG: Holliday junction resolvase-like protein [Dehalococcoidales bacterium]|nr:Holliday junction resolvase-like protein [Dehalococcoidales bacterium]